MVFFELQVFIVVFSQLPRHPAGATPSFIKKGTTVEIHGWKNIA